MIVITGGIGCGKSAVCQLLQIMGHSIYDCDSEAKKLMNSDPLLMQQLRELFGTETYLADGTLNRQHLAAQIFNDTSKLSQMNALVHPAVARDLTQKAARSTQRLFVETAIHFESGFNRLITPDQVWCVAAPLELRIARAMARDHASREQVLARIQNQMSQEEKIKRSDIVIWNDNEHSLIEQINNYL